MRVGIGSSIVVASAVFAVFACKNSNTTEACDNGAGGLSETLCAQWATQGGCASSSLTSLPDSGTLTCSGQPSLSLNITCCVLDDCADASFLSPSPDGGQPPQELLPYPACPDAGAD